MTITFVIIATLLGYYRVLNAIKNGTAKPNCLSWMIWACISIALLVASIKVGSALSTIILLAIYSLGAILTAIASRKHVSKLNGFEIAAICVATLSVVGWIINDNASIALLLLVSAHLCGTVLTLVSTWDAPRSEDRMMWFLFALGNILNLFLINWISWTDWLFPIYETISCLSIWILTFRRKFD